MRINLLDAGLAYRGGHHFDHDRRLLKAFAAAGHEVHAYGYSGMVDEVADELAAICPVTRLFGPWHYEDPAGDELGLFNRQSAQFARDLRQVAPADIWVWPSVRPQQLHACVRVGAQVPVVGSIHEDPGIAARTTGAMLWRLALQAAQERGVRMAVGSVEPELSERFAAIVPSGHAAVFPQPYDGPPLAAPKTELKRIGFFGQQRDEKGFPLVEALLRPLLADGFEIVVHDSNLLNEALAHPAIEVLRYVDDMAAPIATCDLVVLPYDIAEYARKGSGILAECLAVGVPVTAPAGTIPGQLVEQFEIGPLFAESLPDAIHAAIRSAGRDYSGYSTNAFEAARRFAAHHGVARYAEALLAVA